MLIGLMLGVNTHANITQPNAADDLSRSIADHADLICFSHLRWDFVFQRPQHLMTRAARGRRVIFFEEPRVDAERACVETRRDRSGVIVAVPHVPRGAATVHLQTLLDFLLSTQDVREFVAWYYTPMALEFTGHLRPVATVYDCMDELSAFADAPSGLRAAEHALLARANLVLTGGHSLYEAKRTLHPNVYECPSSVDAAHFASARGALADPDDQARIGHPRIGFFGVLDERLDRELLAAVAERCPGWHFVMIGPVAKISPRDLPTAANIHYLGQKSYVELPRYIGGWEVAMLPFARNDATRFISPTKVPEYLAAGRPVVSTSIADVVQPYGANGLARIADTPERFIDAIREALCDPSSSWLPKADAFLAGTSWDATWSRIEAWLRHAIANRATRSERRSA
jgi:glycosyltransferase involved in cell wall biosynthesis